MKSSQIGALTMIVLISLVTGARGQSAWPPGKESAREAAVDWVRSANKFGYDHSIVTDMAQIIDEHLAQDYNLNIFFGSDLMESGNYRSLHLFSNQVLSFDYTPEQAAAMGLESSSVQTSSNGGQATPADTPSFELSDLVMKDSGRIGLRQKFSGTIRCKALSDIGAGEFALRVSYRGGGGRGHSQFKYLDKVPGTDGEGLDFEFGPVNDEDTSETVSGPIIIIFDMVSVDQSGGDVKVILHSRATGTVIDVTNE